MTLHRIPPAFALALALGCSTPPVSTPVDAAVDTVDAEGKDVFIGTGNLVLRWTVRGMPAATGCAVAGGVSVRFPANFVQFPANVSVPCTQGEYRINNTLATQAGIRAELVDSAGVVIHNFDVEANVVAGMDNVADIRFELPGRLTVRWTINGQSPSAECANVDAMGVNVEVQRVRSAMGRACPGNSVTFPNLQVGPTRVTGTLIFNSRNQSPVRVTGEGDVPSEGTGSVTLAFEAPMAMPRDN